MYQFDATYHAEGASRAERAFWVRSVLELRPWQTFGPPVFLAAAVVVALWLGAAWWFVVCFSSLLVLSVAGPLFFFLARPIAASVAARKHPVRHISLSAQAIEISVAGQSATVEWRRIKHVWQASEHVLLVLGKFGNISIPLRSLPPGALEFIRTSAQTAA